MKEASRFGIMNANETGRIVEFEEKPEHPKSNLASMGIYISLEDPAQDAQADMKDPDSSHDFGKDIIPTLLNEGKNVYAYKSKATGKMSERSILSGRQIWTCSARTMSWI